METLTVKWLMINISYTYELVKFYLYFFSIFKKEKNILLKKISKMKLPISW